MSPVRQGCGPCGSHAGAAPPCYRVVDIRIEPLGCPRRSQRIQRIRPIARAYAKAATERAVGACAASHALGCAPARPPDRAPARRTRRGRACPAHPSRRPARSCADGRARTRGRGRTRRRPNAHPGLTKQPQGLANPEQDNGSDDDGDSVPLGPLEHSTAARGRARGARALLGATSRLHRCAARGRVPRPCACGGSRARALLGDTSAHSLTD